MDVPANCETVTCAREVGQTTDASQIADERWVDGMAIAGEQCSHTLALVAEALAAAEHLCAARHTEELVHPSPEPRLHGLTRSFNSVAERVGLHVARSSHMRAAEAFRYDLFNKWTSIGMVQSTLRDPSPYDSAYAFLEDDTSRTLYDWFVHVRVAYATLGEQAFAVYPPPISREDYTKLILSLGQPTAGGFRSGKWIIDSMPGAIVDSILREQYRLPGVVEPQNGDTILDIGAYKGETAIWFADKAGSRGLVLALEPGLQTSVVLRQNVDRNHVGGMAPIRVLQYAIGARQGTARFISSADSGSALGVEGDAVVSMTTVDALVLEQGLGRVDFIKMDIEGGEVDALRGAEGTLRRFSPRLAISVYHRPDDLPDVAALVRQACPNYRLYLSHKSPGLAETVLFAVAASNPEISTTMQAAGD